MHTESTTSGTQKPNTENGTSGNSKISQKNAVMFTSYHLKRIKRSTKSRTRRKDLQRCRWSATRWGLQMDTSNRSTVTPEVDAAASRWLADAGGVAEVTVWAPEVVLCSVRIFGEKEDGGGLCIVWDFYMRLILSFQN